jgi:hypothetical protein
MSGLTVLLLGLGLGLKHATDADHVAVVSALVQREPSLWNAVRIAALWSAGHTVTFLGLGLMVVIGEVRVPATFDRMADVLVGAMLVAFGFFHLARRSPADHEPPAAGSPAVARPVAIGLVHGLAGSTGVALLAVTTIHSAELAAGYLVLVAFGTVLGMVTLTAVLSRPLGWSMRRGHRVRRAVTLAAALLSMMLGVATLAGALGGTETARSQTACPPAQAPRTPEALGRS